LPAKKAEYSSTTGKFVQWKFKIEPLIVVSCFF